MQKTVRLRPWTAIALAILVTPTFFFCKPLKFINIVEASRDSHNWSKLMFPAKRNFSNASQDFRPMI